MPQVLLSQNFDDRVRKLYPQAAIADKSLGMFMRELNGLYPA